MSLRTQTAWLMPDGSYTAGAFAKEDADGETVLSNRRSSSSSAQQRA
ncbi:MAG: hypothetical protein ACLTMP_14240 [Eggerthella lenta]